MISPIVLSLLVGITLGGCDSGPRGPHVDFSNKPESREDRERRVRIVTRRARPAPSEDDVVQLAPVTARESAAAVKRSADRRRGEVLSLGSPRIERSSGRASSAEKLGVLERYLKKTSPSRRSKPVRSVDSFRRSESRGSSRAETRSVEAETGEPIDWQPIFRGIERVRVRASRPRRMEGQALRIDTTEEGVEFITTPKSHRGGDTLGLRTSTFLRKFRCQAAVNAGFFGPMQGSEGRPVDVYGLQVSGGEIVSNDGRHRPSLLITRNNRARIASPPFDLDGVHNAVTGDSLVLRDGRVVGGRGNVHPRVCAGVSRDGRYVYLLTVDGRQGGWSVGASKKDLGNWLKRLGAWDGLNLDGGGTAVMVVEERGRPQIITRPIHNGWPGSERVSGSHLGVVARALSE